MSMNQYMHPRNIYRHPPDFKKLAREYPEFAKFVQTNLNGKCTLDFKNIEALRALTCVLLEKDFNIKLSIPLDRLIPTIPLRLNYLLWIEDLLSLFEDLGNSMEVKGVDIGTGASCVYPLIAASKMRWTMLGTEIDEKSVKYAEENVNRNNYNDLIRVVRVKGDSLLKCVIEDGSEYTFCMCNPPFFGSHHDLNSKQSTRKPDRRPPPKNAFCASLDEVVYAGASSDSGHVGGEVEYIGRLVSESGELTTAFKLYTTMVGHKSTLPLIKKQLRELNNVCSFKQTEFCQGNTTRWGLAWTYCDVDLRRIPDALQHHKVAQSSGKPLRYLIKNGEIGEVYENILAIFSTLQLEYVELKRIPDFVEVIFDASRDTWSHQRRKKRFDKFQQKISETMDEVEIMGDVEQQLAEMEVRSNSGGTKRANDCDDEEEEVNTDNRNANENGYYKCKKIRSASPPSKMAAPETVFVKATLSLTKHGDSVGLELKALTGSKDSLHQIFQYIKNNVTKSI